VSVFQPIVDDLHHLWQQKVNQALAGLLFGAMCAVTFTLAENLFNATRVKWKSWALVIGTWLIVKVTFVSMMAQTGK
jgi:RsiW-degrading membrane proteinase PrsW (M82 family)